MKRPSNLEVAATSVDTVGQLGILGWPYARRKRWPVEMNNVFDELMDLDDTGAEFSTEADRDGETLPPKLVN